MKQPLNERTQRTKPCADCGQTSVGDASVAVDAKTASDTHALLVEWGIDPELAGTIVDLGVRATKGTSKIDVLILALAASAERAQSAEEALDEAELELEKASEDYEALERSYNVLAESLEGNYAQGEVSDPDGSIES